MIFIDDLNRKDLNRFKSFDLNQIHPGGAEEKTLAEIIVY